MTMTPDLASYDVILVNSSAGKDSQAMLDHLVALADAAGVRYRLVVVHCDLGRVEWQGTRELAEEQARHYGLRFEVVSRPQGDLLDHVGQRGKWPASTTRYCTSDHKRGQVRRVMTALVADWRRVTGERRPCRILNCMGLRAEESPARAKKVAFEPDAKASNGKREVHTWLPIFTWTVGQVWDRIRASGVRHHRAYDLGMKRLSCCFCIFAPKAALLVAGEHNRELLDAYVATEERIGHQFRKGLPIVQIREALEAGERGGAASDDGCWGM
jgi:3'-phosphoadenosine 5'-phosphosulfate sulfotransferase (PAPS reductase)/FAD synthetase